jgi:DNA-binding transcriptional MerR regulator
MSPARKSAKVSVVKVSQLARDSGVAASTIKYYVRMGLLPPPVTRPNKQMAYYDAGLVDRIRAIKLLQTERFLPLGTIAKILGAPPRPGETRAETVRARQLLALEPALLPTTAEARTRADVQSTLSLTPHDLDKLAASGLATPQRDSEGRSCYRGADLEILQIIHDTRQAGLGELFPLELLLPYVDAVRALARLEIELFRHRLSAGIKVSGLRLPEIAASATHLGERLVVALRRKLVVSELRALRDPPSQRRAQAKRKRPRAGRK